ncbi:peptidylprolyl isomerase, partial [Campylobacter sp. 2018MI27]
VYTLNPNLDNLIESDMKTYWENNKFNYKDEEGKIKEYELALNDVKIDFALSLLEKEAKLDYIKLKNNEIKFQSTTNQNAYSELVLQNKDLKVGEMSKPFIMDNKYYIVRLDKINQPTALEFEKAKMMVEEDLRELKFKELLSNTGEEELKKDKINGKNIGFISKVSKNNTDLTDTEFFTFVSELFLKNTKKSYVLLNDKVLVYEILSQKLVDNTSEKNNTDLSNELKNINFTLMLDDLIKELDKRYEIKNYYKGSEF